MKLPRRSFLHLAAGAAAFTTAPRIAGAQTYRHGRYILMLALQQAAQTTFQRDSWVNGCPSVSVSHSLSRIGPARVAMSPPSS